MFLFASCNFARLLVAIVFVDAAAVTVDKVKLVFEMIASTNLVSVLPLSFVNEIESPIRNSVVKLVLIPVTLAEPEPISNVPVSVTLSAFALSKVVSAV